MYCLNFTVVVFLFYLKLCFEMFMFFVVVTLKRLKYVKVVYVEVQISLFLYIVRDVPNNEIVYD